MLNGPIEFDFTVEIERSASEVFPLVDLSDPRFSQVALGNTVKKLDEKSFELEIAEMEGHAFRFRVVEYAKDERHASKVTIEPAIGNLVEAVEDYQITPLGDDRCALTLVTKATFSDDLSVEEIVQEVAMMSMAVEEDLTKLKMHAEEGVEAVKAYNEEQEAAFGIELDLEGFDIDWDDIEPEQ
ncbi:hypothetical protein EH31_04680 [Erythrobacter longus]|uniref:Uncharacterized protein n=2 Tax=Erythrobacter longus TaxID=1044 RepID=A0A074MJD4_ERYLO|nr:hypothetical protein EH31_04680 [Erythrobacter longus]